MLCLEELKCPKIVYGRHGLFRCCFTTSVIDHKQEMPVISFITYWLDKHKKDMYFVKIM